MYGTLVLGSRPAITGATKNGPNLQTENIFSTELKFKVAHGSNNFNLNIEDFIY